MSEQQCEAVWQELRCEKGPSHPDAHEAHEHDTVHRWVSPEEALPKYQRRAAEPVGDDAASG